MTSITISGKCPEYIIIEERHLYHFNNESDYLHEWNAKLDLTIAEEFEGRIRRVANAPTSFTTLNSDCLVFQTGLPDFEGDEGYPLSLATMFEITDMLSDHTDSNVHSEFIQSIRFHDNFVHIYVAC